MCWFSSVASLGNIEDDGMSTPKFENYSTDVFTIEWLCYHTAQKRVWGYLTIHGKTETVAFWGVLGKKMDFKVHSWKGLIAPIRNKMINKGYTLITVPHYQALHYDFLADLSIWYSTAVLAKSLRWSVSSRKEPQMFKYEIKWVGWNNTEGHDKVWGFLKLADGRYFSFWGARGKKLSFKSYPTEYSVKTQALKKMNDRGYKTVNANQYDELVQDFINDVEIWCATAILAGSVK
jgi:hypothetical protein